jgi:hypothetical protein
MTQNNGLKKSALTGSDREKYVEKIRTSEGYITHRVHKARFGQNDIFGCIDVLSYDPWGLWMDQISTVHHISDKVKEIERMLKNPPENTLNHIMVHGVDGYATGSGKNRTIHITRHVTLEWLEDGEWERTEMPVPELASEGSIEMKGDDRATMNPPENKSPEINSKSMTNKNKKVKP